MTTIASNSAKRWDRISLLLLVILVASMGLRAWGIWFGLPNIFHPDEGFEIVRALQLGTGQYDFTRIGKGGYFYLLFIEYAVLFVTLLAFGVIESAREFGELYVRDPSVFYLIGRATTAIIGTATVYMLYRTGRLAYSATVAIVAAALLAVNILHVDLSHFTTVDVPVTFLCIATLYFGIKVAQQGNARDYWIAALLAALATSTKMPAVLVLVPLVIAHGYAVRNSAGGIREFLLGRRLWQSAAIFLVSYVIANPGIVLYYDDVFLNMLGKFLSDVDTDTAVLEEVLDERAMLANTNLYLYYLDVLLESMTWPVFSVCMAGLAYALWKRQPADILLASFSILTYLAISLSSDKHFFFPRYMLPAIPCLVLLGARFLVDVVQAFAERGRDYALTAVVLAMAAMPTMNIAAANILMTREDTRAEAKEWVESNIEEGARIFIEGHRTTLVKMTVPLQNSEENIRESIEYYRDRAPGRAKYFKMVLKTQSGKTYDLVGVAHDELQDLQHYKDMGVQYFVLRPEAYMGSRRKYAWPEFVEAIRRDPDIEMIRRFEADPDERPGPLIEIYRVLSNVDGESGGK